MPRVFVRDHALGVASLREPLVHRVEPSDPFCGRDPRKPQRFGIEDRPDGVELLEFRGGQGSDEEPDPRRTRYRPLRREPAEGLTKRSAAGPQNVPRDGLRSAVPSAGAGRPRSFRRRPMPSTGSGGDSCAA